jgi:hypothetical protein
VVEPFGGTANKLSFDRAAVAYTALTRAQKRLLCVLTPAEWELIGSRWQAKDILLHQLTESAAGRRSLDSLLTGVAGTVGLDQRAAIAASKLRDLLNNLPSSGSRTEARKLARLATGHAHSLLQIDRLEELIAEFGGALLDQAWIARQAPSVSLEALEGGDWMQAVASLILVGEYAAACDIFERYAPRESAGRLSADLMRGVVDPESQQRAALAVRRALHLKIDIPAACLLELCLAAEAAERIRRLRPVRPGEERP